jgi:hypothetical protein
VSVYKVREHAEVRMRRVNIGLEPIDKKLQVYNNKSL